MMRKAWLLNRSGALLFFKVICQISRSHKTKNQITKLDPNWGFWDCNSSLNSPMDLKWCTKCSAEEVPYCLSRSSIKFQGHTGWKIDDLNPIWVRLIWRLQLSNSSDLSCFKLIVTCRLHATYTREDYDSNVWLYGLYGLHEPGCLLSEKGC